MIARKNQTPPRALAADDLRRRVATVILDAQNDLHRLDGQMWAMVEKAIYGSSPAASELMDTIAAAISLRKLIMTHWHAAVTLSNRIDNI